jgi:prolyl oligopeptidase
MVTSVDEPGREHWVELVPESDGPLVSVEAIGGALYLSYQDKACTRVAVYSIDGVHVQDIVWPGLGAASVWGFWSRPTVWAAYESFAQPRAIYSYDREANAMTLLRASPMDVDVSDLEVEQVWYPSADGTMISMFLVHAKGAPRDGTVPYLLTGYGGFNISRTPSFSSIYALWAKCGGGVAVTNLRGGGEYGRAWHRAGMGENKQNVFDDFIAAAEFLASEGHTRPERLAIAGGSNGGLLVSAVMTQRPELFSAVLCAVPLTDMVRFPEFGIASIWTEEYGDPKNASSFAVLHAYSPYHNARPGSEFPALLVTGSLNDARTDPVHARKFYAAVEHAAANQRGRWLHIQAASGHHGAVTIDEQAEQVSLHYGFLMAETGLQTPSEGAGSQQLTP